MGFSEGDLKRSYEFIKAINDLKKIQRLSLIESGGRRESDAEHIWHLLMYVWVFSYYHDKPLDLVRVFKLALIHDLPEMYAGDVYANAPEEERLSKKEGEAEAFRKITRGLPDSIRKDLEASFNEYEERQTEEAKFVWAFDKICPYVQYGITKGDFSDGLPGDLDVIKKKEAAVVVTGAVVAEVFKLAKEDESKARRGLAAL